METTKIKIDTKISANAKKVWDTWTQPEHITNWNFASDDWHCPRAENDLRIGGKYSTRMEAKDARLPDGQGSIGFDFEANYDEVIDQKRISYTMSDGRQATTVFENINGETTVEITFDAENQNPIDMQKDGWQTILNNFKKYVEAT